MIRRYTRRWTGQAKRREIAKRVAAEIVERFSVQPGETSQRVILLPQELKMFHKRPFGDKPSQKAKKLGDRVRNELQRLKYPSMVQVGHEASGRKVHYIEVCAELISTPSRAPQ